MFGGHALSFAAVLWPLSVDVGCYRPYVCCCRLIVSGCLSIPYAVFCRLLPGVEDVAQNVADPECRSVASKAHATLLKVGADGKVTGIVANEAEVLAQLGSAVAKVNGQVGEVVVKYVASLLCGLINASKYKDDQWIEVCCVHSASLLAVPFCVCSSCCCVVCCCLCVALHHQCWQKTTLWCMCNALSAVACNWQL